MNFLNTVRNWLYSYIFYYDTHDSVSREQREFSVIINQYSFLLIINFLIVCVFNFFNFNFEKVDLFISLITIYLFVEPFILKKLRINKVFIYCKIIVLTLVINFYTHYCGLVSGVGLYFLPLLFSIPIIFNFKKDKKYVYSLIIFIIINIYAGVALKNQILFSSFIFTPFYLTTLQLLNITCVIINIFLIYLIIIDRQESFFILENRNFLKKEEIFNLKNEVYRLQSSLNVSDFTEEYLKDLLDFVQKSDTIFIEKFEAIYPGFIDKIRQVSSNSLSASDLKYCALFKLGYTTKQIAIFTDTTIKSVESKKYRIRKKLKISTNENTVLWFENSEEMQ